MRIYYCLNARVPTKKAYGIQIAKMCEAFIEAGVDLTLVVPATRAVRTNPPFKEFYRLRVEVPVLTLPGLDRYDGGRVWFFISSLVFMISCVWFLRGERRKEKSAVVYTIDMDTFSFVPLLLSGFPCIAEMQESKPSNFFTRLFFRRVQGIVALNAMVRDALQKNFDLPRESFILENNGVERAVARPSREEARTLLGLSPHEKILAYVGRFYDWKGLTVVPPAARQMSEVTVVIVGGTQEEFERVTNIHDIPENMRFMGECANYEVPTWLAAADALLVVGTKEYGTGYLYRSPMKTYEYMAAERPVVAPRIPALETIAGEDEVLFYTVDDPHSLTEKVHEALNGGPTVEAKIRKAFARACESTWKNRAERIVAFIERLR